MSLTVNLKNIGIIKQAEFSLGDLTIICGENNTGKTYATYALYGFLKSWRGLIRFPISDAQIQRALTERVKIELVQANDDTKLPPLSSRIRWELSRIPVRHQFAEYDVDEGHAFVCRRGIWQGDGFFKIGSEVLPKDVFWEEEHRYVAAKEAHWCFHDPEKSSTIHTWEQDDSIVDWITLFVENPHTYSAQMAIVENDIQCIIRADRTATQNIEDFIKENPQGVKTKQILEQKFAEKRTVYKILRKLQDGKIERIKQGYYVPL